MARPPAPPWVLRLRSPNVPFSLAMPPRPSPSTTGAIGALGRVHWNAERRAMMSSDTSRGLERRVYATIDERIGGAVKEDEDGCTDGSALPRSPSGLKKDRNLVHEQAAAMEKEARVVRGSYPQPLRHSTPYHVPTSVVKAQARANAALEDLLGQRRPMQRRQQRTLYDLFRRAIIANAEALDPSAALALLRAMGRMRPWRGGTGGGDDGLSADYSEVARAFGRLGDREGVRMVEALRKEHSTSRWVKVVTSSDMRVMLEAHADAGNVADALRLLHWCHRKGTAGERDAAAVARSCARAGLPSHAVLDAAWEVMVTGVPKPSDAALLDFLDAYGASRCPAGVENVWQMLTRVERRGGGAGWGSSRPSNEVEAYGGLRGDGGFQKPGFLSGWTGAGGRGGLRSWVGGGQGAVGGVDKWYASLRYELRYIAALARAGRPEDALRRLVDVRRRDGVGIGNIGRSEWSHAFASIARAFGDKGDRDGVAAVLREGRGSSSPGGAERGTAKRSGVAEVEGDGADGAADIGSGPASLNKVPPRGEELLECACIVAFGCAGAVDDARDLYLGCWEADGQKGGVGWEGDLEGTASCQGAYGLGEASKRATRTGDERDGGLNAGGSTCRDKLRGEAWICALAVSGRIGSAINAATVAVGGGAGSISEATAWTLITSLADERRHRMRTGGLRAPVDDSVGDDMPGRCWDALFAVLGQDPADAGGEGAGEVPRAGSTAAVDIPTPNTPEMAVTTTDFVWFWTAPLAWPSEEAYVEAVTAAAAFFRRATAPQAFVLASRATFSEALLVPPSTATTSTTVDAAHALCLAVLQATKPATTWMGAKTTMVAAKGSTGATAMSEGNARPRTSDTSVITGSKQVSSPLPEAGTLQRLIKACIAVGSVERARDVEGWLRDVGSGVSRDVIQ